ncbi:GFA family protein [Algicella marina]|uniref:GFA family protein n=1 Tax=Algicella marina TaxID=2683284 RepID=A0A6P1T249_9RHOB|nr:GFA family protein [Algicella marina]QHQ35733.1 GFA family protein [Algicella marina]
MTHRGSCLCGAVTYVAEGPLRPVVACHCVQCRKTSGHYVAATAAARESVAIFGPVAWYKSSETARRGFCPACGSSLFWDGPGSHLSIHAGTLDGETGLQMIGHIFAATKGDYFELGDDLPVAEADDPALTTQVLDG